MNQHDNHRIDIDPELAPPDRLDAYHRRQLSAMLDGELSPDQARFMLRRLQHDGELAARWERWQVCGDVLRGRGHALLPADFSQRVAVAIASPASAAGSTTAAAESAAARRPGHGTARAHGLLRWGGGALAASVALVALFMARPLPEAASPGQPGDASGPVAAMALVESTQVAPVPVPAPDGTAGLPSDAGGPAPSVADAAAVLLAGAAPAALAVAEVPRRASERGGTRSQSQRAAVRRAQAVAAAAPMQAAVAPVDPVVATAPQRTGLAVAGIAPLQAVDAPAAPGGSLFGDLPVGSTVARPWPRAVLPGLAGRQPYAAGFGQPQAEAFAPFQPRFAAPVDRAPRVLPVAPAPMGAPPLPATAPVPAADPLPSE